MYLSLPWQLPLGLLSYGFFHACKPLVRYVAEKRLERLTAEGDSHTWRGLSEELALPGLLAYAMVVGPRWNTAAVLGTAGPFQVEQTLTIDAAAAHSSAGQWSLVFYGDQMDTRACISSRNIPASDPQHSLELKPGRYFAVVRYYDCRETIRFPTLMADSEIVVKDGDARQEYVRYQAYLEELSKRNDWFYRMMHYYMTCMLRWRKVLPESLVRREYLPVGNPDTHFHFDRIAKGRSLHIRINHRLLEAAGIYLTVFKSCSFPLFWDHIKQTTYVSPKMPCEGHYLIRIHPYAKDLPEMESPLIRLV